MKFKMSQNSIFAVLLRSPWWMSAGVAVLSAPQASPPCCPGVRRDGASSRRCPSRSSPSWRPTNSCAHPRTRGCRPWPRRRPVCRGRISPAPSRPASAAMAAEAGTPAGRWRRLRAQRGRPHGAIVSALSAGVAATASASSRYGNRPRAGARRRGAREAIYIALGDVSDKALQYARAQGVSLMTAPELTKLLRDPENPEARTRRNGLSPAGRPGAGRPRHCSVAFVVSGGLLSPSGSAGSPTCICPRSPGARW